MDLIECKEHFYVITEFCISINPASWMSEHVLVPGFPQWVNLLPSFPPCTAWQSQSVEHRNHRKRKLSAHKSCVLRQMQKSSLKLLENWVNCIVLGPVVNKKEEPRGKFRRNWLIKLATYWLVGTLPLVAWLYVTAYRFPLFQRLRALGK